MKLHITVSGFLMLVLALIHIGFPSHFRWKEELARLSLLNRQMMYVHMFFIALMLGLLGIYCIAYHNELIYSLAGQHIALGISIFWFARLLFQLFVYSPSLWRGKTFETFVHVFFTLLWSYFTIVFYMAFAHK